MEDQETAGEIKKILRSKLVNERKTCIIQNKALKQTGFDLERNKKENETSQREVGWVKTNTYVS